MQGGFAGTLALKPVRCENCFVQAKHDDLVRGNETENPGSANPMRGLPKNSLQVHCFDISEREGRSQAEMGFSTFGQTAEGHHAGV